MRCRAIERVKQSSAAVFLKMSTDFQEVLMIWQESLEQETQDMNAFLNAVHDLEASRAQLTLLDENRLPLTPQTTWHVAREADALADAMWTLSAGEGKNLRIPPKARRPAPDRQQSSETPLKDFVTESCAADVREEMERANTTTRSSCARLFWRRKEAMSDWRKWVCRSEHSGCFHMLSKVCNEALQGGPRWFMLDVLSFVRRTLLPC
jgi:hypothetical protein